MRESFSKTDIYATLTLFSVSWLLIMFGILLIFPYINDPNKQELNNWIYAILLLTLGCFINIYALKWMYCIYKEKKEQSKC